MLNPWHLGSDAEYIGQAIVLAAADNLSGQRRHFWNEQNHVHQKSCRLNWRGKVGNVAREFFCAVDEFNQALQIGADGDGRRIQISRRIVESHAAIVAIQKQFEHNHRQLDVIDIFYCGQQFQIRFVVFVPQSAVASKNFAHEFNGEFLRSKHFDKFGADLFVVVDYDFVAAKIFYDVFNLRFETAFATIKNPRSHERGFLLLQTP